jgi:outer membrane protein assembly factor BamB
MKTSLNSTPIILSVTILSLAIGPTAAKDFAQWRGPLRDGQAAESGLLGSWPKEGPKLAWHVENIGAGYSTPAVVGDRIYLVSNEGLENEFALALSAKDGSQIWKAKVGQVGNPKQQPSYPAARSTPTVDGNRIYVLGSDGDLVCVSDKGEERWRRQLRKDFGGKPGEWAYSESPLVDGDAVICTPGGSNATLVALNKANGEVIWKCALAEGDDASYSSVITFTASGVKQYVQFLQKGLVGVDAKTGKQLWRYEKSAKGSPAVVITPLASDGVIYSGAFRAGGALVKPVKQGDTWTAEEVYFAAKLPTGLGGVVRSGNWLFGSSGQTVMCVDFKSGEIKWEERALGPAAWLVADGRIYLHAETGDVALVEPSAEGFREKGKFTPPNLPKRMNQMEKAWTYPVVADGRLYIRDANMLYCYDVRAAK